MIYIPCRALVRYFKVHKRHPHGGQPTTIHLCEQAPILTELFHPPSPHPEESPLSCYGTEHIQLSHQDTLFCYSTEHLQLSHRNSHHSSTGQIANKRLERWMSTAYRRNISQDHSSQHPVQLIIADDTKNLITHTL